MMKETQLKNLPAISSHNMNSGLHFKPLVIFIISCIDVEYKEIQLDLIFDIANEKSGEARNTSGQSYRFLTNQRSFQNVGPDPHGKHI